MKKNTFIRILTLALAVLLALSATACGGSSKESVRGTLTPAPSDPASVDAEPTEPATETTTPTEPAQEKEVTMGSLNGTTYTNTYAGFGCTLDSNWRCLSADELQELPANVMELLKDTEAGSIEVTQFMDMQAENLSDFTSVNVLYQQVPVEQRLVFLSMTEEEILTKVLTEEKDMMLEAYAAAGLTVNSMTTKKVNFLGQSRTALYMDASMGDVPYYTLQLFDYSLGQYSVTLTVACFGEDTTQSLLDLFYEV